MKLTNTEVAVRTLTGADEAAVAEAVNPEMVYAATVEMVHLMGYELSEAANRMGQWDPKKPFKDVRGKRVYKTDPRHPLNLAKTMAAEAEALINWTTEDEVSYQAYLNQFNAVSYGPDSRESWKLFIA